MENFNNQFQIILNLYKSREFYRAEKLCKKLILKYPRLPILYNVLGLIFTEEKKTDKAILYLEKGIKILVPPFINSDDKIILDTRTLEYIKKIK